MASSGRTTAIKGGTGTESTPANNIGGDRRVRRSPIPLLIHLVSPISSITNELYWQGSNSGGLFSGLINQKRNSTDAAAAARRQSFHDQKPAAGFIGKMWHKYVILYTLDS
jgi:hypothetical protein